MWRGQAGVERLIKVLKKPSTVTVEESALELEQLRDQGVTPEQLQHVLRLLRQGDVLRQLAELEQLQGLGLSVPELLEQVLHPLPHRS